VGSDVHHLVVDGKPHHFVNELRYLGCCVMLAKMFCIDFHLTRALNFFNVLTQYLQKAVLSLNLY